MDCSTPGFPVLHYLLEFAQTHVHWVGDAIQLSHPLPPLLLPSIFPSIRVFSNELALHIGWPKYCSFSLSISPSSEYSGLISLKIDWFDLLAAQGTLKSLLQQHFLCLVTQSCLTLCDSMVCSTPGFPVLHHLPEFAQTHVHWVSDAIQPSYPLSSPSPPAFRLSLASGSFPMSRLFSSGSQSIEAMCKARLGVLLSVGRGLWVQIQIALTLKVRFFLCCFLGRMGIQICNGYVIELSHVEIYI